MEIITLWVWIKHKHNRMEIKKYIVNYHKHNKKSFNGSLEKNRHEE